CSKVLCRDLGRCATVPGIITLDRIYGGENVVDRFETEQAFSRWNEFAKAGFLGDYRAAGGQVAGAAVTEPASVGAHVLIAGDGEFGTGLLDVRTVAIRVTRNRHRIDLLPAVLAQQPLNVLADPGCQFKSAAPAARQLEEFFK